MPGFSYAVIIVGKQRHNISVERFRFCLHNHLFL